MKSTTSDFDESIALLDGYLRGHGTEAEAASLEEDVFERAFADAAPELVFVDELVTKARQSGERGTLDLYIRAADVARVRASNRKVQMIELENRADLQSYVLDRDADVFIARVPIDLRGVDELDIEVFVNDSAQPLKVMRDVAFDEDDGAIFMCCEGDLARATANIHTKALMYGRDAGGRRLIAEVNTFGTVGA